MGPRYTKPLNQTPKTKVLMSIGEGSLELGYKGTHKNQYEVQHVKYKMDEKTNEMGLKTSLVQIIMARLTWYKIPNSKSNGQKNRQRVYK
jgi:hypothetical protein